jgi:ABC-2 type transport system ATP-binding protein
VLANALATPVQLESDPVALSARTADPQRVAAALAELAGAGVTVDEFALGQPSLDEVFLALTGHPAENDDVETTEDAA